MFLFAVIQTVVPLLLCVLLLLMTEYSSVLTNTLSVYAAYECSY